MYGKRDLKNGTTRKYYRCTFPNAKCKARLMKDLRSSTGKPIRERTKGYHNHDKPTHPRVVPSVVSSAKHKIRLGLPPIEIEKQCILDAEDPSPKWCPSREMIRGWKSYLRTKDFPTKDVIQNVIAMFQNTFLLEFLVFPCTRIICAAPYAIKLLAENGDIVLVDGTFDLTALFGVKLILTTVMVLISGWGVPVAWMLSDSRAWETYCHFFRVLSSKANRESARGFNPRAIVGDFEEALRRGSKGAFPSAAYLGDFFHFMQANVRWWKKLVGERDVPEGIKRGS